MLAKLANSLVRIVGNSDNTTIGNVLDRLKVDASFSTPPSVADIEYATFSILADNIATASNKSMLSIVNTSGSTVRIRLRDLYLINAQNSAVTGVVAEFCLIRCVTHSAGTLLTPLTYDTSDSLNSSVTARTGATIGTESSGHLRHWEWSTDEWAQGAQDVESSDHVIQSLTAAYVPRPKTKPITLNANEGITLKCLTNTTTGLFDIMITFTQE